jgi:hypothetical protein
MDVGWFRTALVAWLPVAVVATVLAATSYVTTQQLTRSSVDDAPRAMAERAADTLSRGGKPAGVTPGPPADLATDLGPFLMVFGPAGAVRASTARLDGAMPVVPPGVLAQARQHGIDRITWHHAQGCGKLSSRCPGTRPPQLVWWLPGRVLRPPRREWASWHCLCSQAGWSRWSAHWRWLAPGPPGWVGAVGPGRAEPAAEVGAGRPSLPAEVGPHR